MFKKLLILLLFSTFYLLFTNNAQAAQITLKVPISKLLVGDEIPIDVYLNTENEEINAVDLNIQYPKLLTIQNISKSGSAIQLWVSEPSFTKNEIHLSGGVPGGVKGQQVLLARIQVQANAVGEGSLGLVSKSKVLLNDGLGTEARLTFVGPAFEIKPKKKDENTVTVETESKLSKTDHDKPESFSIIISDDPKILGGQKFASFFATDSSSGIDHYEIKEGSSGYKLARSPYLLSDQKLHSTIKVKAIDSAGNYQTITYYPGYLKIIWQWISGLLKS